MLSIYGVYFEMEHISHSSRIEWVYYGMYISIESSSQYVYFLHIYTENQHVLYEVSLFVVEKKVVMKSWKSLFINSFENYSFVALLASAGDHLDESKLQKEFTFLFPHFVVHWKSHLV